MWMINNVKLQKYKFQGDDINMEQTEQIGKDEKVSFLTIKESLQRCYEGTFNNKEVYTLTKDKNSVVKSNEKMFFKMVLPPKMFERTYQGKIMANYVMQVLPVEWDNTTKQWVEHNKNITLKISKNDYNFLTTYIKPLPDDRLSVQGKFRQTAHGLLLMKDWSCAKANKSADGVYDKSKEQQTRDVYDL